MMGAAKGIAKSVLFALTSLFLTGVTLCTDGGGALT